MNAVDPGWVQKIEQTLKKRTLVQKGARLAVAVSGGLDSMVLLHVLHSLAARNQWKLLVAHFNHQLRGQASDADERLVARVAMKMQLPMVCGRGDVVELQKEQGISLEMAARKLRHEFLAEAAIDFTKGIKQQYPTVALAHHANDQSELFFLRLFRGAGGEGIAGMRWSSVSPVNPSVRLIRPLLDQTKPVLLDYARQNGIPFREDASNQKIDILRNRIRHQLLPKLRREFQTDLDAKISRLMETIGAEADYIRDEAQKWLNAKKQSAFEEMPVALQRQIIRLQLRVSDIEPDFECVEYLRNNPERRVSVGRDVTAQRNLKGAIVVIHSKTLFFKSGQTRLDLANPLGWMDFEGMRIEWQVLKGNTAEKFKKGVLSRASANRRQAGKETGKTGKISCGCECFDADAIGAAAILRHWRPGDRFQPIGMSQPVKIQDLMTNLKIAATDRRAVLVAESETNGVFWVQGLRMAELFKIRPETKRCLRWSWHSRNAIV